MLVSSICGSPKPFFFMLERLTQGKYQWRLFVFIGCGWAMDICLMHAVTVIGIPLALEFNLESSQITRITAYLLSGMFLGASILGYLSDVYGRRIPYLASLLIAGISAIITSASPNYTFICIGSAALGVGIGANIPIAGTLFLEFLPTQNQSLLTLLSTFLGIGQLITASLAWIFLPRISCSLVLDCPLGSNYGWRILLLSVGAMTLSLLCLTILFGALEETPRFLISKEMYLEAEIVLNNVAKFNGKEQNFADTHEKKDLDVLKDILSFAKRIERLFNPEWRLTTSLIWTIYTTVAIGNFMIFLFLPKFLKNGGESLSLSNTFRNFFIASLPPIFGPVLGMYAADSFLGRKYSMTLASIGCGAALYLFTISKSSTWQLIATCIAGTLRMILYSVLFTYAPEVFNTDIRGTAVGVASALGRISGSFAPILTGILIEIELKLPLFVASIFFFATGVCMVMLPKETRPCKQ